MKTLFTMVVAVCVFPTASRAQVSAWAKFEDSCTGAADYANVRQCGEPLEDSPLWCTVEVCIPDRWVETVSVGACDLDVSKLGSAFPTCQIDESPSGSCPGGTFVSASNCSRDCVEDDFWNGTCSLEDDYVDGDNTFVVEVSVPLSAQYEWSTCGPVASLCAELPCNACEEPGCGADDSGCESIHVASGEVTTTSKLLDAAVQGGSRELVLQRRYSSKRAKADTYQELVGDHYFFDGWGGGWHHDYDYFVTFMDDDYTINLGYPNGKLEQFVFEQGAYWATKDPRITVATSWVPGGSYGSDPEVTLTFANGEELRFMLLPSATSNREKPGILRQLKLTDGYSVDVYHYGVDSPECDDSSGLLLYRRCGIVASDGAAMRFAYGNIESGRATSVYFGRVAGSVLPVDVDAFASRTRYTYVAKQRKIYRKTGQLSVDVDDGWFLRSAISEDLLLGGWVERGREWYSYTDTSYHRPDLGQSSPYENTSPLRTSVQAMVGQAFEVSQDLLHTIRDSNQEFVEAHEYTASGAGAADITANAYIWVQYESPDANGQVRVVAFDESSGNDLEYLVKDGVLLSGSGQCVGTQIGNDYVRDPVDGAKYTRTSDSPADNNLTVDTTYYAPGGSMHLVQQNYSGDPAVVTSSPYAPTRVSYRDYDVDSKPGSATTVSSVFSALCREAPALGLSCDGYTQYAGTPSTLEAAVHFDYDTDYELGYANFNSQVTPGDHVTQSETVGWTTSSIATGMLDFDAVAYGTQTYYVPGTDKVSSVVDEEGQTQSFEYYSDVDPDPNRAGQLRLVRWNGSPILEVTSYDGLGRPTQFLDENALSAGPSSPGTTTTLTYDREGRVLTSTVDDGTAIRVQLLAYRPDGSLSEIQVTDGNARYLGTRNSFAPPSGQATLPSAQAFCSEVTAAQDVVDCVEGLSNLGKVQRIDVGPQPWISPHEKTHLTRNDQGLVDSVSVIDETNGGSTFLLSGTEYNSSGWPILREKYVASSTIDSPDFTAEVTAYNDHGQPMAVRDYRTDTGSSDAMLYDELGRIISVTEHGDTTTFEYDLHDNLVRVVLPNLTVTEYLYDDFGRVVIERSSDRGELRYLYDGVGNLIERLDGSNVTTSLAYDGRHRLTEVDYGNDAVVDLRYHYDDWDGLDGSYSCGAETLDFTSNNVVGRLGYVSHGVGRTFYAYTAFGEVSAVYLQRDATFDPCALEVTSYEYDFAGRITAIVYPSGLTTHYRYKVGGYESLYPQRIDLEIGGSTETVVQSGRYVPGGHLRSYQIGSTMMNATWDFAGQAKSVRYEDLAYGNPLFDWQLTTRDGNGNIELVSDETFGQDYVVTYDDHDRVETVDGSMLRGYQDCDYSYDASGNRNTEHCYGRELTFSYDADTNRHAAIVRASASNSCTSPSDDWSMSPDAAGRISTVYEDVRGEGLPRTLAYGAFDRVVGVDVDGIVGDEFTYSYDHRQLRLLKKEGTSEVTYSYSQKGKLLSVDDGAEVREYIWLHGVPILMLVTSGGQTTKYTLASDHLGAPRRAWEYDTNEMVWAADYEVFGKAHTFVPGSTSAPTLKVDLRAPGQIYDEESGLHYNWWRYYDPETGRYTRADPLGLAGGDATLASFAFGNGLSYVDVTGLRPRVFIVDITLGERTQKRVNKHKQKCHKDADEIVGAQELAAQKQMTEIFKKLLDAINTLPAEDHVAQLIIVGHTQQVVDFMRNAVAEGDAGVGGIDQNALRRAKERLRGEFIAESCRLGDHPDIKDQVQNFSDLMQMRGRGWKEKLFPRPNGDITSGPNGPVLHSGQEGGFVVKPSPEFP